MSFPDRKRPLAGLRVLVTRPEGSEGELRSLLEGFGATVIHVPTIRIAPPPSWKPLDQAISRLDSYDWLLFTSANGARSFFSRVEGRSIRPKIAVIGPKTAEAVRAAGAKVAKIAEEHVGEGLADALGAVAGKRVLLVKAAKTRDALAKTLKARGAQVSEAAAYRTLPMPGAKAALEALSRNGGAELALFTSSSAADNLHTALGPAAFRQLFSHCLAASIGPITTQTLRRRGIEPVIEAKTYTGKGLVEAIARALNVRR